MRRSNFLLLILSGLLLSAYCQKIELNSIALYSDNGAAESCVNATKNMFEWMGYTVKLITADYIDKKDLDNFSMICFPGGDMYRYSIDISSSGKEKIRNFISNGGGYIGICGGAYFTGEKVFWQGNQLPMEPLSIFPGITRGPVDEIAPYPNCVMCEVNIVNHTNPIIESEKDSVWIQYCYGPMFLPNENSNVEILGEYEIGDSPSIIAFEYGHGRVFIIGTHPEFEEDSDRDGYPPEDNMDDLGSDWDLMKRATDWCLKKM